MKVRAVGRLLEEDGWRLTRTKGGHRQYEHPSKPGRVTVAGKLSHDVHRRRSRASERYLVLIEGNPPSNYSAWSPDLPGCVATGQTIDQTERELRAAIAFHLEALAQDGAAIADPSGPGVYVERTARSAA